MILDYQKKIIASRLIYDNKIDEIRSLLLEDDQLDITDPCDPNVIITFQDRLYYIFKVSMDNNKNNLVEMLVYEFKFDLSYKNYEPLIYCTSCEFEMFKFLINYSEINLTDPTNEVVHRMMKIACEDSDIKLLKFLLQNGVDPNLHIGEYLTTACEYGHLNIVNLLIDSGANIGCGDNKPLFTAIKELNYPIVKLLIQNGADMEAINKRLLKRNKVVEKHTNLVNLLIEKNIALVPWIIYLMTNQSTH